MCYAGYISTEIYVYFYRTFFFAVCLNNIMFRMSKQSLHLFKVMTQIYKKYFWASIFRFTFFIKYTAQRIDIHYLLYPHKKSIFLRILCVRLYICHKVKKIVFFALAKYEYINTFGTRVLTLSSIWNMITINFVFII